MRRKLARYGALLLFLASFFPVRAQEERSAEVVRSSLIGLEYRVKAGFNLGGAAPIPLPAEIRSIESYNPTLVFAIEGNVTKWMNNRWGLITGLRFESKGMKTDAKVKGYQMEMVSKQDGALKGVWTGSVKTHSRSAYMTVPLLATWKYNKRLQLELGGYYSLLIDGSFSGTAYDGYLRKGDPTGEKVLVSEAAYDFSDDLRNNHFGFQMGAEWRAFTHLNMYGDFTWGVNNIFKDDFKSISFAMYPIYLTLGFAYLF
ncbi:MAG: porin family protein [Bacteroidales bacterium]|nr:porin family protein [Bacteroidales bacterium]MDD4822792.1 porin family protein [Bacteroidales bacterium]